MPPERAPALLLVDIPERADAIAEALQRLGEQDLAQDDVARSAVLWSLAIIGEAAARMPAAFRQQHPEIEWNRVAGFRNFIVHTYERINESILDETARQRVPVLQAHVHRILRDEFPLVADALERHEKDEG